MIEITLPHLAESVVEGEILRWLVQEGEPVQDGQPLLEVMTDKVTVELPSTATGILRRQRGAVGQIVAVGAVIAELEEDGGTGPALPAAATPTAGPVPSTAQSPAAQPPVAQLPAAQSLAAQLPVAQPPVAQPPALPQQPAGTAPQAQAALQEERSIIEGSAAQAADPSAAAAVFAGFVRPAGLTASTAPAAPRLAAPSARRLARGLGVPLESVRGSGAGGSIRAEDVTAHAARPHATPPAETLLPEAAPPATRTPGSPPAPLPLHSGLPAAPPAYRTPAGFEGRETRQPFSGTRRAIAGALHAALLHTAQTHTIEELDVSGLDALRAELLADEPPLKVGYLPLILRACALALREYPALNSSLDTASGELVYKDWVNLGVAVNTDAGLVVPVIAGAEALGVAELGRRAADLAGRARSGQLQPGEMQGATFTVSNIGAVGALVGVPIVAPPAAAVLSVHSVVRRPVAVTEQGQEQVAVRPMVYLTLSFDHRLVDGADAARCLRRIVWLLTRPARLLR